MRRRSTATMLAITLATLFGTAMNIAPADATTPGGWRLAANGHAPVNHRTGLPAGTLPTRGQLQRAARANTALRQSSSLTQNSGVSYHLTYNGGPVVSNVQVQPVRWGGTSADYTSQVLGTVTPNMQTFFQSITQAPYAGWLSEYNTIGTGVAGETGQRIGAGSVSAPIQITPASPANGSVVDDAQIQQELINQFNTGALHTHLPTVDGRGYENTTYTLYFPQGVNICQDSTLTQCSGFPPGNPTGSPVFCGYHSSFQIGNATQKIDVRYIVLPYPDATWQSGCSDPNSSAPAVTGLEAVASHELAEVITDPEVGEANNFASPLGWYDGNGSSTDPGEIADVCDAAQPGGHTTDILGAGGQTYTLENLWSNRVGGCAVATKPTSATNAVARPTAGGTITVGWSASSIPGGSPVQYDVYETPPGGTRALAATTSGTSWTSPALTNGSSYTFDVVARNGIGSAAPSASASATADATAPVVTNTNSLAPFTPSGSTKVTYKATDTDSPTGITYDVAYKAAAWNGGWGALTTLAHATTATSATLALKPGTEYCLVVRARDTSGNVSHWSAPRCTAAPLDDPSLTAITSGWTRTRVAAAYRGTVTRSSKAGARLGLTGATANRLGLVVGVCSTCGNVQIYLGSTLWKTVSTRSAVLAYRQVKLPGTFSTRKTSITLRVGTGLALIDGLGISRPAPTF